MNPAPSTKYEDMISVVDLNYLFWTTQDFDRLFTDPQDFQLEIPTTVVDNSGQEVTSIYPAHFYGPKQSSEGYGPILTFNGQQYGKGAFANFPLLPYSPAGPYEGDHVLHIGSQKYYINNVKFNTYGEGLSNIPFPVYEMYTAMTFGTHG